MKEILVFPQFTHEETRAESDVNRVVQVAVERGFGPWQSGSAAPVLHRQAALPLIPAW